MFTLAIIGATIAAVVVSFGALFGLGKLVNWIG